MLDKNEKRIDCFNLRVLSRPISVCNYNINDVIDRIKHMCRANGTEKKIRNRTASYWIADFQMHDADSVMVFLLNYGDKNMADPVFTNMTTKQLRPVRKQNDEGGALSCHVAISTKIGADGSYCCLSEHVPYFGVGAIERYINTLNSKSYKDDYFQKDGKVRKCCPAVELDRMMSQSLKEDLVAGKFEFLELVKTNGLGDIDENKDFTPYKQVRVFYPKRQMNYAMLESALKSWWPKLYKEKYSKLIVRFKDNRGRQRHADVIITDKATDEIKYAKYGQVKLREGVDQGLPELNDQMCSELVELVVKERRAHAT